MQVRGSLAITRDLTLSNPGGTAPAKGLVALSDSQGNVRWGHLLILPLDVAYTYPDKGTLVIHMGKIFYSLVNKAKGTSLANPYIWKEITSTDSLTKDQMDAIENASAPSAQNPFVTLGDLQNNTTELRLEGDVTGYSQYEDGVLVIYTEIAGQVPGIAGADFTKESFPYIGEQSFILSRDVVNILMITVNGQLIDESQYSITNKKQLNILDELDEEDHIIINYNFSGRAYTASTAFLIYQSAIKTRSQISFINLINSTWH
jgi:hypothetical protein